MNVSVIVTKNISEAMMRGILKVTLMVKMGMGREQLSWLRVTANVIPCAIRTNTMSTYHAIQLELSVMMAPVVRVPVLVRAHGTAELNAYSIDRSACAMHCILLREAYNSGTEG